MKLVEILARELNEWADGVDCLGQWPSGVICNIKKNQQGSHDPIGRVSMSDDEEDVTRAQWEAERERIALNNDIRETVASDLEGLRNIGLATDDEVKEAERLATNQQATKEAREIARTGSMTSEEQELAAIACGKRSKEDQELWDKVAVAVLGGVVSSDAFHNYPNFQGNPEVGAEFAAQMADAFMAERAKRMK